MRKMIKFCMSVAVTLVTIFSVTLLALKVLDIINPMCVKKYIPIFGDDNMSTL